MRMVDLTQWGLAKRVDVLRITFLNAFLGLKIVEIWFLVVRCSGFAPICRQAFNFTNVDEGLRRHLVIEVCAILTYYTESLKRWNVIEALGILS